MFLKLRALALKYVTQIKRIYYSLMKNSAIFVIEFKPLRQIIYLKDLIYRKIRGFVSIIQHPSPKTVIARNKSMTPHMREFLAYEVILSLLIFFPLSYYQMKWKIKSDK